MDDREIIFLSLLFSSFSSVENKMGEYQDPLLTPGHIKKIVQNLPGKIKV
jgi:hypothetical protein